MYEKGPVTLSSAKLTLSEPVEQKFTIEDMRAAFYAGKDHTADEYRYGETIGFDEWIKTRMPTAYKAYCERNGLEGL